MLKKQHLSRAGKEQWKRLSDDEKANYRQKCFLSGMTEEKERLRRESISKAESSRSGDEWKSIVHKRKQSFLDNHSADEILKIREKQGQSLSNTINNMSPEQRRSRNIKTGIGRKKSYERETAEHRRATIEKVRNTCLERYGVEYFTLTKTMQNSGRMRSSVNKKIESALQSRGIAYEVEFTGIAPYSYDFKIGQYLIEINPSATHNCDWSPFGDHGRVVSANYHEHKTKAALEHGYVCVHIFDWMNFEDYIDSILHGEVYLEKKDSVEIFYYDVKRKHLSTLSEYEKCNDKSIVRIFDDGYYVRCS